MNGQTQLDCPLAPKAKVRFRTRVVRLAYRRICCETASTGDSSIEIDKKAVGCF